MNHSSKQSGFTLVELAIVLVIIGLIVGGVLVGQDLIKAATIRSVVSDIEKYNAAATTFRGKYNSVPGDMLNTKAVQFNFNTLATDASRTGGEGRGDGDGIVEGCAAASTNLCGETALYWSDLTIARLVPQRSTITSASADTATQTQTVATLGNGILPKTRLRDTALVTVFPILGRNMFSIGSFATSGANVVTVAPALTPLEAGNIDQKLDDGEPLTGTVDAITALGTLDTAAGASGCVGTAAAGNHYNTVSDNLATTIACAMSMRASF